MYLCGFNLLKNIAQWLLSSVLSLPVMKLQPLYV